MPGFPESMLPAAVLADLRGVMDATLTDTATVARTGEVIDCYLDPQSKDFTIERGLRLHSYAFSCDYQQDVKPGDVVTLTADGTSYAIQGTSNPRSQPVALDLVAIPTSLMLAAILAPEQATFQHPTTLATVPASVYVIDNTQDAQLYGMTPAYPWMGVYENTVAYEGGGRVGEGHLLLLSSIFGADSSGTPRAGILSRPRPILHGLPFMVVSFKEMGG